MPGAFETLSSVCEAGTMVLLLMSDENASVSAVGELPLPVVLLAKATAHGKTGSVNVQSTAYMTPST